MDLTDLSTPALILDRRILARNIDAMSGRAHALGVGLRPHLKTAKSADVARLALAGNSGGITVSTLNEAAYFLEHGIADITYAVGMAPGKLDGAAALMDKGADFKIITDNAGAARAIAGHGGPFHVLIEIDTGDGRGGVQPQGPELLDIARIIDGNGAASLAGVLTHADNSYGCRDEDCMIAVAGGGTRRRCGGGRTPARRRLALPGRQRRVYADGALRPGPHRRHRDAPRGVHVLGPVPGGDRHLRHRRHRAIRSQLCHRTADGRQRRGPWMPAPWPFPRTARRRNYRMIAGMGWSAIQ